MEVPYTGRQYSRSPGLLNKNLSARYEKLHYLTLVRAVIGVPKTT